MTKPDSLGRILPRVSPLASFFRNASEAEKEKVYEAVLERVTEEQTRLLEKAICQNSIKEGEA
jgi:hypothetical protein